jgi:hypothetical protein
MAPNRGTTRNKRVTSKAAHRASPKHSPRDQTPTHVKREGPPAKKNLQGYQGTVCTLRAAAHEQTAAMSRLTVKHALATHTVMPATTSRIS